MLPTFLIVGAGKAGTTSLYEYLRRHPEIHMSPVKEPRFFAPRPPGSPTLPTDVFDRERYEALFDSPLAIRGEASPMYSMYPREPGVVERIRETIPDARFIYMLRDPVERAISHYFHGFYNARAVGMPEEAFADVEDPYQEYVCASRYATQLERYLSVFAEDRVLVLDQTELAADHVTTMRRVFAFLGADPAVEVPALERHNVTAERRMHRPVLFRMRTSPVTQAVVGAMPQAVRSRVVGSAKTLLSGPNVPPPEVPPDVMERLRAHLAPEAQRVRELTGQSFSSWSV